MTGIELKQSRHRARLSQRALAKQLGVSERTLQLWERKGVPEGKDALVREALAPHLSDSDGETLNTAPLSAYSNLALIAELARRLEGASLPEPTGATVRRVNRRGIIR